MFTGPGCGCENWFRQVTENSGRHCQTLPAGGCAEDEKKKWKNWLSSVLMERWERFF